jgi:hypothetical protein
MSTGTDAPADTADGPTAPERDELLALLEDGIREAHRKVENGRVRDAENEKVRQGWIRALAYAVNSYRQLKRDEDLEEMKAELEALKVEVRGPRDPET